MAVDVTTGFCSEGALSSERVGSIVPPIVRLFELAHGLGVRHFVMPQDTHAPDAVEFGSYPPHCVRGSDESQTVVELRSLPFSDLFTILEKNSLSVSIGTGLDDWLAGSPGGDDISRRRRLHRPVHPPAGNAPATAGQRLQPARCAGHPADRRGETPLTYR